MSELEGMSLTKTVREGLVEVAGRVGSGKSGQCVCERECVC